MKKTVVLILAGLLLMLGLTACGNKEFTCDMCGEEKTGKSHSVDVLGDKMTLCDECYKEIKALGEDF